MKTDIPNLIQRAAEALARADLTSAEARDLRNELGIVAQEIDARLQAIRPRSVHGMAGPVRTQVAATGSDADLVELDREHERLAAQAERLSTQRNQLNQRRHVAMAREASEGMPAMLASLAEAVDALEAAHKAVTDREQAARQVYTLLAQARGVCRNAGLPAATGDREVARRFVLLMPDYARHKNETAETIIGIGGDHLAAA